ncbi:MAG: CcmD family protein [Longimicrobiales bacterium]
MSEWNYIVAAYTLTWIVLAAYGIHVARRARRAERDFENMETEGGAT